MDMSSLKFVQDTIKRILKNHHIVNSAECHHGIQKNEISDMILFSSRVLLEYTKNKSNDVENKSKLQYARRDWITCQYLITMSLLT